MPDQSPETLADSPSSSAIWPPPPTLPNGPKQTIIVDGIEIIQDNENLTLRNVRKSFPREYTWLALYLTLQFAIIFTSFNQLLHDTHGPPAVHALADWAVFKMGFRILMVALYAMASVQIYFQIFTHYTFTKRQDTSYLATISTIYCPVSLVSHFRVQRNSKRYDLTLHQFRTKKKSKWDFLKAGRLRPIAKFRNADDAERVARQLAEFAGVQVEFK